MLSERYLNYDEELKSDKILLIEHRDHDSVLCHGHSFLELTYILRGEAVHTLDSQSVTVHKGDYFIVDHGSVHSYSGNFDNIDCIFLPEFLDPSLKGTISLRSVLEHYLVRIDPRKLAQNPAHMIFHDDSGRIAQILSYMKSEGENKPIGYSELQRCLLIEILLLTVRSLEQKTIKASNDITAYIEDYIAEHYPEEISLGELAKELHYSLPYLSQKFRKDTGETFVAYLQSYRVLQGCRLLSTTDKSLTDIAEAVGYRDPKYFSALLKRFTGHTPFHYRKNRQ